MLLEVVALAKKTVMARDGHPLDVRIVGRGQPVLLLHGLGMKAVHWLPFIWPYTHRFRFYMPDFRAVGAGNGVSVEEADVFQMHMEDVQDVVDHFGLQDFLLVGYSLGGSTALHWQRMGGFARVCRYLHIEQTPCIPNREDWKHGLFGHHQEEGFTLLIRLRVLLDQHAHYPNLADLPFPVRRQATGLLSEVLVRLSGRRALGPVIAGLAWAPCVLRWLTPLTRMTDMRIHVASYLDAHDYRPSLRDCPTPITVIVGMGSPLYAPAGQMAIAALARECRVVRFEKSGHLPLLSEPLKFTRELGRFLYGT